VNYEVVKKILVIHYHFPVSFIFNTHLFHLAAKTTEAGIFRLRKKAVFEVVQ
jgi:Na+-translocating ferredoxin:NAD+ oxidoreductase RnfD subunit